LETRGREWKIMALAQLLCSTAVTISIIVAAAIVAIEIIKVFKAKKENR